MEWKQRYRLAGAFSNPNSPFRIDRSEPVVSRNRYPNVQPWDGSRVKLKTPIGGSDYINASPISLKSLTPGSHSRGRSKASESTAHPAQSITVNEAKYIASQGPKDGQFSHFWHMALQESQGEVGVIVMLTQCYEGTREKCAEYFPLDMENPVLRLPPESKNEANSSDGDPFLDSDDDSADTDSDGTGTDPNSNQPDDGSDKDRMNSRDYTDAGSVELLSMRHDGNIGAVVRELKVTIGDTSKKFYHFFYGNWADFGRVEPEDRVALLQLTRVSKHLAGESPRIVHCSAGVGRTGTWIALDYLLRELEEGRLLDQNDFQVNSHAKNQNAAEDQPQEQNTNTSTTTDTTGKKPSNGTWGKSGPPKTTTPEPKENDLIHDTVDSLRTQRMMMVMNEIQYGSLYEVLREQFIDKYADKATGPIVSEGGVDVPSVEIEEPSPKVARTSQGSSQMSVDMLGGGELYEGSRVSRLKGDEENVSESEAETVIDDSHEQGVDVSMDEIAGVGADGDDPYAAADPKNMVGTERHREGDGVGGEEKGMESEGKEGK